MEIFRENEIETQLIPFNTVDELRKAECKVKIVQMISDLESRKDVIISNIRLHEKLNMWNDFHKHLVNRVDSINMGINRLIKRL